MTPAADLSPGDVVNVGPSGIVDLIVVTPQTNNTVHLRWGWGEYDTAVVWAKRTFEVLAQFEPKILL